MLVLMGLVLACLIAEEHIDAQRFVKQTTASTCMTVVADDLDLDEDDDEVMTEIAANGKPWALVPTLGIIVKKAEKRKCSQALIRGLVRRHSPRSGLAESHNYVISETIISGGELFLATFFVLFTSLLTKHLNK